MTFLEQLFLTLLDKFLIAFVLLGLGYWTNRNLQTLKGQQDTQIEILKGQQNTALKILEGQQNAQLEILKVQQNLQAQKDLQIAAQIAAQRLPAYKGLWQLQESVSPTLAKDLAAEEKIGLETKMRTWFFHDGNGIFLSHMALTAYRSAMACLQNSSSTSEEIRNEFSDLRKQMKLDMKVYNEEEAETPTG